MANGVVNQVQTPEPKLVVDGVAIPFNIAPRIINDRVYVEMRSVFEYLGFTVTYDADTKETRISQGSIEYVLENGVESQYITYINLSTKLQWTEYFDNPALIVSDRTMFSLRTIAYMIRYDVDWDEKTYTASLIKAANSVDYAFTLLEGFIEIDKAEYTPDWITVSISGKRVKNKTTQSYISVYEKGSAEPEEYQPFVVQDNQDTTLFYADYEPGEYEVRLFNVDYTTKKETIVMAIPFTVTLAPKAGSFSINAPNYMAGSDITITLTGITKEMQNAEAFVGVYKKGADHNNLVEWYAYEPWLLYPICRYLDAGDSTQIFSLPYDYGEFEVRLYTQRYHLNDDTLVMSIPFTLSGTTHSRSEHLYLADMKGIIPAMLKNVDLTMFTTRQEFAAIAAALYEKIIGETVSPAPSDTFTDCSDTDVLRLYTIGVIAGTAPVGETSKTFDPNARINREEAAAIITRLYKKYTYTKWTLSTDSNFKLYNTMPSSFADDKDISAWAKESVYFAANYLMSDGNKIKPRNITVADEAIGYANITRDDALILSVHAYELITGKDLRLD